MRTPEASLHYSKWTLGVTGALIAGVVIRLAFEKLSIETSSNEYVVVLWQRTQPVGLLTNLVFASTLFALLKERTGMTRSRGFIFLSMVVPLGTALLMFSMGLLTVFLGSVHDSATHIRERAAESSVTLINSWSDVNWLVELAKIGGFALAGALGGLILGALQRVSLRKHIESTKGWVSAMAVGGALMGGLWQALTLASELVLGYETEAQAFLTKCVIAGISGAAAGYVLARAAWKMRPLTPPTANQEPAVEAPFGRLERTL